jgi:hypothetical protein
MRSALLLVAAGVASAAPASPSVSIYESREVQATTEGDAIIAIDPDTAYLAATDYTRWPAIFPALRQAIVTGRQGAEARVTFVHADGSSDHVHFRNRPASHTVWFEQHDGHVEVWAEITFAAGERAGTSRVHARFHADVHGLASMFASSSRLRAERQRHLRDDLAHLQAHFAR